MFDGYDMDHNPIDFMAAAMLLDDGEKRQVAYTDVDGTCVSTVFVPHDMSHGRSEVPILYETMVFDRDGETVRAERYATKEAALAGHDRTCAWVKSPHLEADPAEAWGQPGE